MTCPNCQKEIIAASNYCYNCGARQPGGVPPANSYRPPKHLVRSSNDKKVGGVCAGLADYFDVHLDHAPKEGATLPLDSIVLVARSIGGSTVTCNEAS